MFFQNIGWQVTFSCHNVCHFENGGWLYNNVVNQITAEVSTVKMCVVTSVLGTQEWVVEDNGQFYPTCVA